MSSAFTAYMDNNGDNWFINSVELLDPNKPILGSNGVIHPVAEILKSQTIREMVDHIDSLNEFSDILDHLLDNSQASAALLLGAKNITLFAPVNGAISDLLLSGTDISNLSAEQVDKIVKEHILIGQDSLEKEDFERFASTNTIVWNLAERGLTFTKTSGVIKVNGTKIKNYDIKCKNGNIHIIDNALGGWPS